MYYSQFNTKVPVTEDLWAVTMIKQQGIAKNHAMLIIEGVKNEKLFTKKAHLTGVGSSNDKNISENGSKCSYSRKGRVKTQKVIGTYAHGAKTPTWQRFRDTVEKMLQKIKEEKKSYNSLEIPNAVPFNFFGNKSIIGGEYKYLEITHPELEELQNKDPISFSSIYKYSMNTGHRMMHRVTFGTLQLVTLPAFFIPYFLYGRFVIGDQICCSDSWQVDRLVDLAKEHIKERSLPAHNCFTWAREKLRIIDVHMEEKFFDRFISVTSLYTGITVKEDGEEQQLNIA